MRKKSDYSTKKTNSPLYSLSNEKLEALNKNSDDANLRWETGEILRLRRNINVLSRTKVFAEASNPIEEPINQTGNILFSFFGRTTQSHRTLLLGHLYDTGHDDEATYPISLYLEITASTTIEEIKNIWKEIKYWRDYINDAQRDTGYADAGQYFLSDLHTQNMAGRGYGSLAKKINQTLRSLFDLAASNQKWINTFEKELRAHLSKQKATGNQTTNRSSRGKKKKAGTIFSAETPSSDFPEIRQRFTSSYSRTPERKILFLDAVHRDAPLKCLSSIPKKNPYSDLEAEALAILLKLGYTKEQGEECIKTAMQDISEGRTMKEIVTALKIRETLRWWRNKYHYPSPGKEGVG